MPVLLLLLQLTVGDTVRIERVIQTPPDAVVRPQAWSLGELGAQLAPPTVQEVPGGTAVRYLLVIWYPGEHSLRMPGPVVVRRDGSSDTLAASLHRITVASVLPGDRPRSSLNPRPAETTLPLGARSLLPLGVLAGAVLLLVALALLAWRRRGPPPPLERRVHLMPDPTLLAGWAAAGEYRAALDGWSWRLARRMGESRDLAEVAALQQVLDEIADQVFAPGTRNRLAALCARAAELDAR
jgi:hypothetical protein